MIDLRLLNRFFLTSRLVQTSLLKYVSHKLYFLNVAMKVLNMKNHSFFIGVGEVIKKAEALHIHAHWGWFS